MGAKVVPVTERHADAQGRDQRGDPRLGDERRRHALHHRLGRRARTVSAHGARFPGGDRPRGARADARAQPAACRARWSPAWAAARTRWESFTRSSTTPTWSCRRRGRGRRARHRATLGVAVARDARRAARLAQLPAAGRSRSGASRRTRSRRGSTIPASGPSTRSSRTPVAPTYVVGHRRRSAGGVRAPQPPRRHHPRARDRARRRVDCIAKRGRWAPDDGCSCASAAGVTRTSHRS